MYKIVMEKKYLQHTQSLKHHHSSKSYQGSRRAISERGGKNLYPYSKPRESPRLEARRKKGIIIVRGTFNLPGWPQDFGSFEITMEHGQNL